MDTIRESAHVAHVLSDFSVGIYRYELGCNRPVFLQFLARFFSARFAKQLNLSVKQAAVVLYSFALNRYGACCFHLVLVSAERGRERK